MNDENLIGLAGMVIGMLLTALGFVAYMQLANLQPVPVCHEDEVIVWNDIDNEHDHCFPLDDLIVLEGLDQQ